MEKVSICNPITDSHGREDHDPAILLQQRQRQGERRIYLVKKYFSYWLQIARII